jgi:hypothetical protein
MMEKLLQQFVTERNIPNPADDVKLEPDPNEEKMKNFDTTNYYQDIRHQRYTRGEIVKQDAMPNPNPAIPTTIPGRNTQTLQPADLLKKKVEMTCKNPIKQEKHIDAIPSYVWNNPNLYNEGAEHMGDKHTRRRKPMHAYLEKHRRPYQPTASRMLQIHETDAELFHTRTHNSKSDPNARYDIISEQEKPIHTKISDNNYLKELVTYEKGEPIRGYRGPDAKTYFSQPVEDNKRKIKENFLFSDVPRLDGKLRTRNAEAMLLNEQQKSADFYYQIEQGKPLAREIAIHRDNQIYENHNINNDTKRVPQNQTPLATNWPFLIDNEEKIQKTEQQQIQQQLTEMKQLGHF